MSRLRLAYLFTTFPEISETFLQREVRAMRTRPVDFTLHSIWHGSPVWEGLPVERFDLWRLGTLLWWLPYWLWRRPRAMWEIASTLARRQPPSWLNAGENLLGVGFALIHAHRFESSARRPHLSHAVWATVPAAAGWMLERLLGIPYTMGAHAYDVFQHGGDWLLEEKLSHARLIHTTTFATRARLLQLGADPNRIALIRRGLDEIGPLPSRRNVGPVLHLLAIGRLIPKKGFGHLLDILKQLRARGVVFECRIIGAGPLEAELRNRAHALALDGQVFFPGALPYGEVAKLQREWADIFLFTGIIAPDGDRDGLPNVIPEAMAVGLPVITSPVAGTTEAITHEETGLVIPLENQAGWCEGIIRLAGDAILADRLRRRAHTWVVENFDADNNAAALAEAVRHAVFGARNPEH